MSNKIIVLTGATASGKTNLAIKLAKKIKAQIICADSRIVYKNIDIASAKPTIQEQDGIIHHLIDIIEPTKEFSAGDFVNLAKEKIEEIKLQGDNIIITGGTWFYIKSLLDKKELIPCPINKNLREELSKLSSIELWEKLNSLDENRAQLIHPNNKDKIIRSIEIIENLGCPIKNFEKKDNIDYCAKWYMPNIEREALYEKINKRVDIMMDNGLFEEWKKNKELYPNSKILFNTIGYREFFDLEKGLYENIEIAIEKIKQHTRNFAKRQLTYFRSNQEIKPINSADEIIEDINA